MKGRDAAGVRVAMGLLVVGLSYLVLTPLVRLQGQAFSNGAKGFRDAFSSPGIGRTITTTIVLAVGSLTIAMVLGTGLALAGSRLPRRLRWLDLLPIAPLVIPAVAATVGWVVLFSPRPGYGNELLRRLPWWSDLRKGPVDIYTVPWIVILTGFGLTSFVYIMVRAGLQNIDGQLIESALVHGSSPTKTLFTVTIPLLRPVLLYSAGVALLLGLGQFTNPLLIGRTAGINVLTTEMYYALVLDKPNYGAAAAFGLPLLILGIAVVVGQRLFLGDQTRFVTHSGRAFRTGAKPSRLAALAIATYGFLSTILPLAGLTILALSPFWTGKVQTDRMSLDNFRTVLGRPTIRSAIENSFKITIISLLIAIPIGFIASGILLAKRRRRIVRTIVDVIVMLPLGIPAIIFGVGFLLTYTHKPFVLYGTTWVVVLVYVTLMLPFTTRMQLAGRLSLGDVYTEASRVSGAGTVRTNLRIVIPLMRGTLGGTAALLFVIAMHEFTASLLVRSATTQVMGTLLFDLYSNGGYPVAACMALIMTFVTAVGVAIALSIGGRGALRGLS